jgi:hypothetical protein
MAQLAVGYPASRQTQGKIHRKNNKEKVYEYSHSVTIS